MRTMTAATLTGLGLLLAGVSLAPAANAPAPATGPGAQGIPCAGLFRINERATIRATGQAGPSLQFYESWGPNGWMRMNTQAPETAKFAEWHFEQFNEKTYQVFGSDPSLGKARKVGPQMVEATRVRLGEEANSQLVIFAEDCSRVTMYKAEGIDRHAPAGQQHYYNDLRVYDRVMPPAGSPVATVAPQFFGGWVLNRAGSKLTRAPKEAESVVIVPWEKSGWVWNQISGGPYQPEGVKSGVKRVECGAATGAAAVACEGEQPGMMLYWATFDAKPYDFYGTTKGRVQLRRIDDRNFEVTSGANRTAIVLTADGNRMTVTTKSAGAADDVRVYDRIDGVTWPTVAQ
jgi:hypothetical protein